jgi:hypothetical protein
MYSEIGIVWPLRRVWTIPTTEYLVPPAPAFEPESADPDSEINLALALIGIAGLVEAFRSTRAEYFLGSEFLAFLHKHGWHPSPGRTASNSLLATWLANETEEYGLLRPRREEGNPEIVWKFLNPVEVH